MLRSTNYRRKKNHENEEDHNRRLILESSSMDCVVSDDDYDDDDKEGEEGEEDTEKEKEDEFTNIDFLHHQNRLQHHSSSSRSISTRATDGGGDGSVDDDDISLYVNANTEHDESSTIIAANTQQHHVSSNHHQQQQQQHHDNGNNNNNYSKDGTGGGGNEISSSNSKVERRLSGSSNIFRGGLSKSASMFLSQDRQTLNELLNVDQDQEQQPQPQQQQKQSQCIGDSGGGNNDNETTFADENMLLNHHRHGTNSTEIISEVNDSLLVSSTSNNNEIIIPAAAAVAATNTTTQQTSDEDMMLSIMSQQQYDHRIKEMEIKHEHQMKIIQREWEHKLMDQERILKSKYDNQIKNLRTEISRLKLFIPDDSSNNNSGSDGDGDGCRSGTCSTIKECEANQDCTQKSSSMSKDGKEGDDNDSVKGLVASLTSDQIARYSRQLLLSDGFGVQGQRKLLSSSVLGERILYDTRMCVLALTNSNPYHIKNKVIGAGGIGSTVLLYLAASGVGTITVVDFDSVEMSNLHRQVIHCEANVGMNKAVSACRAMKKLNPTIECTPIQTIFNYDNAMDIIATSQCDCIIDACDNPQTRYVCNDVSILSRKPLVSGSAMGTEGQLTVYGYKDSACYRCLYPKVNPTEGCKSCSDNGVLGTVPGLIGIMQATEALKILTGVGATMHDRLLMYDSMRCTFLNIKKAPRRKDCLVCQPDRDVSIETCKLLSSNARGPQHNLKNSVHPELASSITKELNISCKEYKQIRQNGIPHILLDVRVKRQFEMCSLSGALNLELRNIENRISSLESMTGDKQIIYCICRRGIASREAALLISGKSNVKVLNINGGYNAWKKEVDPSFPSY